MKHVHKLWLEVDSTHVYASQPKRIRKTCKTERIVNLHGGSFWNGELFMTLFAMDEIKELTTSTKKIKLSFLFDVEKGRFPRRKGEYSMDLLSDLLRPWTIDNWPRPSQRERERDWLVEAL